MLFGSFGGRAAALLTSASCFICNGGLYSPAPRQFRRLLRFLSYYNERWLQLKELHKAHDSRGFAVRRRAAAAAAAPPSPRARYLLLCATAVAPPSHPRSNGANDC